MPLPLIPCDDVVSFLFGTILFSPLLVSCCTWFAPRATTADEETPRGSAILVEETQVVVEDDPPPYALVT